MTTTSPVSRLTCTRVTPGTSSSADRTATMQPSQIIPSTASVTMADRGTARQPAATAVMVSNSSRLVIDITSHGFTNPSNPQEERADREYKRSIARFFTEIFGR